MRRRCFAQSDVNIRAESGVYQMPNRMALLILLIILFGAGVVTGRLYKPSPSVPARHALYYVDPMHPKYTSPKPGVAPDCGMDLVPVYADSIAAALPANGTAHSKLIHVDSTARQLYGIQLATVQNKSGSGMLHVYGRVAADESRSYSVNMGTEGYVKEVSNDLVGAHVTRNQHLALVYSPEFLSVAGGYLSANERTPANDARESTPQTTAASQARADRLRSLGMSDVQIEAITRSRKIPEDVYIVAPADGFIVARNISKGLRFGRHVELYRIADLSRVWIIAEAFGRDADAFHPGAKVHVTLPDTGEHFTARVSENLPEVNPVSHAINIRLEVANPAFHLRPGMFVDIEAPTHVPRGLTIPLDSIIDSGLTKRVFVESGEGNFQAREIETGPSFGDEAQVLSGLREGEKVVASGTFLMDSESRMHSAGLAVPPGQSLQH